jgi:hypothetical protein
MPPAKDDGDANLGAALSGDVSLAGSTKEQITAMGGEVDDELDSFKSTPADRGDSVDPPAAKAAEDEEDPAKKDAKDEDKEEPEAKEGEGEEDKEDPAKKAAKADDKEDPEAKEGEGEEDEEDSDKKDAKDEDKAAKKPAKGDEPRIPKSRFDEVNARRKAAEDELAQLKANAKAKDEGTEKKFDFKKAEREYLELALDGKIDLAMAKREEIDSAKEAVWESKQAESAKSTVAESDVQKELKALVAKFEGEYDALDSKHEDFSEDLADEVQSMFLGYLENRRDLTTGEAFKLAVGNVVKIYELEKRGTTSPGEVVDEEKNNVRLKDKKDVKKKVEAAKKAPKDPAGAGVSGADKGEAAIDIEQMTDDEFNALPESTKARMRGDTL